MDKEMHRFIRAKEKMFSLLLRPHYYSCGRNTKRKRSQVLLLFIAFCFFARGPESKGQVRGLGTGAKGKVRDLWGATDQTIFRHEAILRGGGGGGF